jgi:lysophospholipase L1-like esterase
MSELLPSEQVNRDIPARPQIFDVPLRHMAARLAAREPVKIVAIGSSSTVGEGDIVPYPQRLQTFLRSHFKDIAIDVLNRGKGGEEAPEELARFDSDVLAATPDVVIWQIGTNAVYQARELTVVIGAIRAGLGKLAAIPADVILMDLQYIPAVLTESRASHAVYMASEIERLAAAAGVNVFRRFDLMRRWHQHERVSFDRMVNPNDWDRLHHSDWATDRISWALFQVMLNALR